MKDLFSQLANKRAAHIAEIDTLLIAPVIRNHLLQLFRAAHAVEPTLKGVLCGNGTAVIPGTYLKEYEDGESQSVQCCHWHEHDRAQPKHPETLAFMVAVYQYADRICSGRGDELPYINDITLDDLKTGRAKKAQVWGPRGLRNRA